MPQAARGARKSKGALGESPTADSLLHPGIPGLGAECRKMQERGVGEWGQRRDFYLNSSFHNEGMNHNKIKRQ